MILSIVPKGQLEALLRSICGIVMTVSILSSASNLSIDLHFREWLPDDLENGKAVTSMGEEIAGQVLRQRIKQQTEEYILDKATSMNISLSADITLSETDPPVPVAVTLTTSADPVLRTQLERLITQDLGISKEQQRWMEMGSEEE